MSVRKPVSQLIICSRSVYVGRTAFVINPFIPPKGVTVESYTPSLAAAFKAAFSMPNPLPDIFLGAVNDCYTEYGWKKSSTIDDPDIELFGMYEFIRVFKKTIEHSNYKGETKANIESAGIVRLISLIEQNSNIYDTIHLKEYLNELLAKPNDVEIETYNEIEYNELIMRLSGDVELAKEKYDAEMLKRESDLNIISSIIGWIYDFSNDDVNGQMRLNMFTLVKTLQEKAADSYFKKYRAMYKDVHPVQILEYSADVNFAQEVAENSQVEAFYQEQQSAELATVKNLGAYIAF